MIIPESPISKTLKRVEDSFERLVEARKKSVKCLLEVGNDIMDLDKEFKAKKAQVTAVSAAGNMLCF